MSGTTLAAFIILDGINVGRGALVRCEGLFSTGTQLKLRLNESKGVF